MSAALAISTQCSLPGAEWVRGQVRGQLDLDLVEGVWSRHCETDDTERSHRFADSPSTRQ
ncbi:MAG: hypothetical protein M3276_07110 [Actinomycetota bacterium]|nr:hypothetical protein [Actinomycetota bacterium]